MSDFYELVGFISTIITFISLLVNMFQYTQKKSTNKALIKLVQEQFNNYFYISRSLTRVRNEDNHRLEEQKEQQENKGLNNEKKLLDQYENETNYIRGICDSSRESLICFGREQLDYQVFFEHPAFPGKKDYPEEVLMGTPVDQTGKKK